VKSFLLAKCLCLMASNGDYLPRLQGVFASTMPTREKDYLLWTPIDHARAFEEQ
jgi:hypothetical protein